jgi:hypothetical protein
MPGADRFRRIALGMDGAIEIFATLHHDHQSGMVKLTPEQQQKVVRQHPDTFAPENGAWGRGGCTKVRLDGVAGVAGVNDETLGEAMTLAWQNIVSKKPAARRPNSRRTGATRPPTR